MDSSRELLLPFCLDCGRPHLPPGPVCPYCLSAAHDWKQGSGRAFLSTRVVERRNLLEAFNPPYIVAEVQLEEGPRMPAQVDIEHRPVLRAELAGRIGFQRAGMA